MTYNTIDGFHMALSTGDDSGGGSGLTAWRNADAAFIAGELIPADIPLGWSWRPPLYETTRAGIRATATRVPDRYSNKVRPGQWKSQHAFQTCQFIYWIMQTAAGETAGADPYTHTLAIGTSGTPKWHGIHFERESITGAEERWDLLGFLPSDLIIECGESPELWAATQEITIPFAKHVAGTNLAAQTPRPSGAAATTGQTAWKTWDHTITGNGGGTDPSGLTYNSAKLEVDVTRIRIHLHRNTRFTIPDSSGYYIGGLMQGFDYSVELDVLPTGDLLYDVNKVKKESYAGDLDYTFSFNAHNTNDKITFTFDKMFLVPFDEDNDYNKWIEGYTIRLEPLDETSSLSVVGIDGLDSTHFGNP